MKVGSIFAILLAVLALTLSALAVNQTNQEATSRVEERTQGSWTMFNYTAVVFLYNKETGVVYRYFRNADNSEGFLQLHPRGSY